MTDFSGEMPIVPPLVPPIERPEGQTPPIAAWDASAAVNFDDLVDRRPGFEAAPMPATAAEQDTVRERLSRRAKVVAAAGALVVASLVGFGVYKAVGSESGSAQHSSKTEQGLAAAKTTKVCPEGIFLMAPLRPTKIFRQLAICTVNLRAN